MMDQAEKLRRMMSTVRAASSASEEGSEAGEKSARVFTVTSGKGGVGKTNVTINLAVALSELGLKVVVLDADFGLANIDILFGIMPKYTLADVIQGDKNILDVLSDGPNGIKFISGGSGVEELVKMDSAQIEKFIGNIALLDKFYDIILIDTGAGLSDSVMSFVLAADEVILITTPEPTSITDAYALVKMVSNKDANKDIKVVVNRAENEDEAMNILNKLSMVVSRFLPIKIHPLGFILQDENVIRAVKQQQPFTLLYPKCQAARYIRDISQKLIPVDTSESTSNTVGIRGFINKFVRLIHR